MTCFSSAAAHAKIVNAADSKNTECDNCSYFVKLIVQQGLWDPHVEVESQRKTKKYKAGDLVVVVEE